MRVDSLTPLPWALRMFTALIGYFASPFGPVVLTAVRASTTILEKNSSSLFLLVYDDLWYCGGGISGCERKRQIIKAALEGIA